MFKRYYSLAQCYSTHYLLTQTQRLSHEGIMYKAFSAVLKTRQLQKKKHK